ncbi:dihydroxy-acid dehydratase [Rhodococcoides fascians]|uniref:dihydroxy-acid dehydratase n=1 Tax=Rhodococcoides fascians TaxID=1828 RepID=UPI00055CE2A2|nr:MULTISPECIES: dihydroxy-acid dehydratase [Rhodococcus]OZF00761.1 dihydroxy-acid dehydratase [Rhodococcus sp. 15-1189-1-1a]OZF21184.1 dihydroxy-acid dehydratase [Rhodococcus sp. 14-2686-1-2]
MSQRDLKQAGGALFSDEGPDGFLHRAFQRGRGLSEGDVRRNPVIGICSSWSELNPCNAGLRDISAAVKRGIEASGGLALEFPTISISEPYTRPTSMYLRNLMSMDVEEAIATAPIDGVVLLGGCDKTVPAQIMGAVSADKPAAMVTAGPREVSCWKKAPLTTDDVWDAIDRRRLGEVTDAEWKQLEGAFSVSVGTCNVLGTAITMAAIAEVLGFALPGSALPGATSVERLALAESTGRTIVDVVARGVRPRSLITRSALENCFRMVCALGGSANAVIHLEAIAGRAGITLGVDALQRWANTTPNVARVRPLGPHLLSDLDKAGGVPAVMRTIADVVDLTTPTVTGRSWREHIDSSEIGEKNGALSRPEAGPKPKGALRILSGNLAPAGAVLKVSDDLDGSVMRRKVVIFEGVADLNERIDSDDLDVDADSALVLRGVGIIGAPGMPEVGHIPIPAKLARQGVTDMLRITDARMSGTATGCVVLHVAPESAIGGPLAYLRDGDLIELDIPNQRIDVLVDESLFNRRTPEIHRSRATRGYGWMFEKHALQPDSGCDFDFLRGDFSDDSEIER